MRVVLARPLARGLTLGVGGFVCFVVGWPVMLVAPLLIALGALGAGLSVWRWERTRVVLTTEKLFVVARHAAPAGSARSSSTASATIEVEQSLLGRMLGYGTLSAGELEIPFVPQPRDVGSLVARLSALAFRAPNRTSVRVRRSWLNWAGYGPGSLVVHGAREHNLKDITVRLPRNKLVCITGLSGSGQVQPGLRHDLRGGPAALRREPERVRAAVPADDGEAGRRVDRRPLPGDLDRPEDDEPEPALDGRHRHRDLRLPAPALRAGRPSALPGLRPADRRPEPRRDRRPGAELAEGTRFTVNAPVVRDRKGEYKDVFEELRREGFTRVKVDGELHAARGGDRRSTRSSSTRSRSSSTGS